MNLKIIIEQAEKKAGSQKALAQQIGLSESHIRSAKSGARGLPNYACSVIAEILNIDEAKVIAASEIVTEKNPNRIAYWKNKLKELDKKLDNFFQTEIKVPSPLKKTLKKK